MGGGNRWINRFCNTRAGQDDHGRGVGVFSGGAQGDNTHSAPGASGPMLARY